jgi:hypothetical protein
MKKLLGLSLVLLSVSACNGKYVSDSEVIHQITCADDGKVFFKDSVSDVEWSDKSVSFKTKGGKVRMHVPTHACIDEVIDPTVVAVAKAEAAQAQAAPPAPAPAAVADAGPVAPPAEPAKPAAK